MHFDNCGNLCAPVTFIKFPLGIYVELGQEGLEITFVLDKQNSRIEVFSEGQFLVAVSFAQCLSDTYAP